MLNLLVIIGFIFISCSQQVIFNSKCNDWTICQGSYVDNKVCYDSFRIFNITDTGSVTGTPAPLVVTISTSSPTGSSSSDLVIKIAIPLASFVGLSLAALAAYLIKKKWPHIFDRDNHTKQQQINQLITMNSQSTASQGSTVKSGP